MNLGECESCANYVYDEELEQYLCDVDIDEDEYIRFLEDSRQSCAYYQNGDEYRIVRHQI